MYVSALRGSPGGLGVCVLWDSMISRLQQIPCNEIFLSLGQAKGAGTPEPEAAKAGVAHIHAPISGGVPTKPFFRCLKLCRPRPLFSDPPSQFHGAGYRQGCG